MKSRLRFLAAIAVAVLLSIPAPPASAHTRDASRWDVPRQIIKIVKKLQHLFNVSAQDDSPTPPRP